MKYRDDTGVDWQVREFDDDRFVFAVLLFETPTECRAAWGSPIQWRRPENLAALFDLAVPV
jgi:hypothetical protein